MVVLAHAFEDSADRLVGLVGRDAELVEFAAVRVVDVFRQRNHRANHRRAFHHRPESLLDGGAGDHVVPGAVVAHVREIVQQERVAYRGRSQRDDVLALLLFEAEDQVGVIGHLTGQPSGTETGGFDAHAIHEASA